jgi:two-component system chemotaxis response regulator CheB
VIKLLIVDDSPLMRRLLSGIFAEAGDFAIEIARNGDEAIDKLKSFAPDVITLDIHMPGMDGLACLDRIMLERPCPVVMVSALTEEGAEETLEAMSLGAVDFFPKPRGAVSIEIEDVAPDLVERVRQASRAQISRASRLTERVRLRAGVAESTARVRPRKVVRPVAAPVSAQVTAAAPAGGPAEGLVLVGPSTGGPPALDVLLGGLPAGFPWPILVAQHMPASFTGPLARRLDRLCALAVSEVTAPTLIERGNVYIGKGDADMLVSRRKDVLVAMPAPLSTEHYWHPSVERLVSSAMKQLAPENLIGVLMTGMGSDGATAMTVLNSTGGRTIAESADTAVVWGMPGALVAAGGAGVVLPLDRIAAQLVKLVRT